LVCRVKRVTAPIILKHRLDNGLKIVFVPDDRVPVVSVCLTYAVGSRHERPGRSGFAHLFEHMMFEGSANVLKTEHFQMVESAGGIAAAFTGWDSTVYIDTLPSHELELALWLEADRLGTLADALSQETLDNQRDVVKNERRSSIDNVPYGTAEEEIFRLVFPSTHPYSHSLWGSMDDLSAASLQDVQAFFQTYYVPNNVVLTIVGDIEANQAIELVDRHFGPISPGAAPPSVNASEPELGGSTREVKKEDVPLPRLFIGCPIPPYGRAAFDVADLVADMLVSGRASRLQRRLIRELRLAQQVDASAYPLVDGAALLLVDVTASEDADPADLEAALLVEINRLADEPPDEEELARIRLRRATTHAVTMQDAEQRADRIGMYACLLDEPERFGKEAEIDLAITGNAVREVARETFSPENRTSLWYLPSGS
jgi:zinc protease